MAVTSILSIYMAYVCAVHDVTAELMIGTAFILGHQKRRNRRIAKLPQPHETRRSQYRRCRKQRYHPVRNRQCWALVFPLVSDLPTSIAYSTDSLSHSHIDWHLNMSVVFSLSGVTKLRALLQWPRCGICRGYRRYSIFG
jgi:hypothetical protein